MDYGQGPKSVHNTMLSVMPNVRQTRTPQDHLHDPNKSYTHYHMLPYAMWLPNVVFIFV
jgi:hypothetical protein